MSKNYNNKITDKYWYSKLWTLELSPISGETVPIEQGYFWDCIVLT